MKKIELPSGHALVVSYGGGVDSTAMLIAMKNQGIKPDLIVFADTGGEKPETYDYVRGMDAWLDSVGFPNVSWVKNNTLDRTPYNDLNGNNTENATLPSLAMGGHSCSIKWKIDPQDNFLKGVNVNKDMAKRGKTFSNYNPTHPLYTEYLETGVKIVRLIGYDNGKADIRRSNKAKKREDNDFLYSYPLQDLEWEREDCIKAILEEGLEVPIKSACWFCPASQKWELFWLAGAHPDLFEKALEMEHKAMVGPHSRWGSDECTYDKDWEEFVKIPAKQWPTTKITVGLGRTFAWNHWARENGIVNAEGKVIADPDVLIAKANLLKGDGGNASDSRPCELPKPIAFKGIPIMKEAA